ncbi:DUF262 domain-containing protein [Paraburkholderia azotifigens]|uniref:DUF262 domain-containing protein n=1 Tax=Paraburkholderia azotifigens TaxID=2057004 RepID=A0ABU9R348_9BURK
MALDQEIEAARKEIISDGYDMSIGEVMNLYRDKELVINPEFQRLFRWDETQKTRFIESLLLGIPIPPIFVVQNDEGIWELIDGLQRLSTVLEFSGQLMDDEGKPVPPSMLGGTKFLPSLSGKMWERSSDLLDDNANDNGIGKTQQLQIKRARLRVEILKKESDPKAKYELFQRLNTGGAYLTPQEVRNCVAVMVNRDFYTWLVDLAKKPDFVETTSQTSNALEQQMGVELALRFLAFRRIPYSPSLDVHEYLDAALVEIAEDKDYPRDSEQEIFELTFGWLKRALGDGAFKKWSDAGASGKFLMSVFEVVATGVSKNAEALKALDDVTRDAFLQDKVRRLWTEEEFLRNSGGGVRGTTRLAALLPFGPEFFKL